MLLGLSFFLLFFTSSGEKAREFSRDEFPKGFVFGAGTSAYQVEGAAAEDGRTPSIWDTYTHAGHMVDKSTGDMGAGQYYKFREDVNLMSEMGLEAYRFSISWSRVLPHGRGAVNPKGLEYYNNLIDELISHGIQPHVTLYHLDLPQILEDEYGGWLSPKIVEDFTGYANVCFKEFGDRVKYWTTFNEPNVVALGSYDMGLFPPQRCSFGCEVGNSSVEPYIMVHHTLLAHASAAKLYKEKYQGKQKGQIGINLYCVWMVPLTNSRADVRATKRAIDFFIGWIMNPLVYGDYPVIMKKNARSRIPTFTKKESELVKGGFDFFGINYYTTIYAEDDSDAPLMNLKGFSSDMAARFRGKEDDEPSRLFVPFPLPSAPAGLRSTLDYIKEAYGNPPIYIQENGLGLPHNESLIDTERVDYLKGHIGATLNAIRDGSNVRGYIMWSFLDVFEFLFGYSKRYGLYHVHFDNDELTRRPKLSALWYSNFLKKRMTAMPYAEQ